MDFQSYQDEKRYYEEQAPEQEFLDWYANQDRPTYPKPSVTVDLIALRYHDDHLQILLVQRKRNPDRLKWALPGGFIEPNDHDITAAAIRETKEETGLQLTPSQLIQLPAVGTQNRDPRGWTITNPHIVLFKASQDTHVVAQDDANNAQWFDVQLNNNKINITGVTDYAFDHQQLITNALLYLKHQVKANRQSINYLTNLLPQPFTIKQLLTVFHALNPDEYTSTSTTNSFFSYYKSQLQEVNRIKKPTGRPARAFKFKAN